MYHYTYMGRLAKQRCYLAGPIDYAEDDGVGWRKELSKWLKKRDVVIMDPTNKKTSNTKFIEVGDEQNKLMHLRNMGRYQELREEMKPIILADLRMVETSDFVVVYLNPDIRMCGTWEELFISLRQRKPTFVVAEGGKANMSLWLFGRMNPDFIFESFEELTHYLDSVDRGLISEDVSRWVFFNE